MTSSPSSSSSASSSCRMPSSTIRCTSTTVNRRRRRLGGLLGGLLAGRALVRIPERYHPPQGGFAAPGTWRYQRPRPSAFQPLRQSDVLSSNIGLTSPPPGQPHPESDENLPNIRGRRNHPDRGRIAASPFLRGRRSRSPDPGLMRGHPGGTAGGVAQDSRAV